MYELSVVLARRRRRRLLCRVCVRARRETRRRRRRFPQHTHTTHARRFDARKHDSIAVTTALVGFAQSMLVAGLYMMRSNFIYNIVVRFVVCCCRCCCSVMR